MFRANSQRTGVYKTTGVRQLQGLKWKSRRSSTVTAWKWGLAVGSGVVCVDSPSGNLYGLDLQAGEQLWLCQLGKGKKFFPLAIADGVVYVGSRQLDSMTRDEYLHAIDIQTGQVKWQSQLLVQLSFPSFDSVFSFSSPAIVDRVAYIGANDGNLLAIDTSSGELIWSFKTTKNMPLTSPAADKETVCVYSRDGYLYAIDVETKQQRWKFEIGALPIFLSSVTAIANGRVYTSSSDNTFNALDLQTGQSIWAFAAGNQPFYSPAVTEQVVCVGNGEGQLYALDVETGQPIWRFRTENMRRWSDPIIAERVVYIGSQGFLQALDLETGEKLWRFETPLPDQWILDPNFWLYGLMNQLVKVFTGDTHDLEKFSAPVIADGVIYISCSNGYLYALH